MDITSDRSSRVSSPPLPRVARRSRGFPRSSQLELLVVNIHILVRYIVLGRLSIHQCPLFSRSPSMSKQKRGKFVIGSRETRPATRAPNWTKGMDETLLSIFREQYDMGNWISGSFTRDSWRKITDQFNELCSCNYEKDKILNRWKTMKRDFHAYVYLQGKSEWAWDDIRKLPIPPTPDAWEQLDEPYRKFKNKTFDYYDEVEYIVGHDTTRGRYAYSSQQEIHPPTPYIHVPPVDMDTNISPSTTPEFDQSINEECMMYNNNSFETQNQPDNEEPPPPVNNRPSRRSIGSSSKKRKSNEVMSTSSVTVFKELARSTKILIDQMKNPMASANEALDELCKHVPPHENPDGHFKLAMVLADPFQRQFFMHYRTDPAMMERWISKHLNS